jgi:two-component system CheB/CheR fusion protein
VLESVLTLYHPKIASAGVHVQREFQAAAPILGASGELRQVFSNLIINAVDAMRHGGCLTIRIRNRRDPANPAIHGVRISIADSGMGIPTGMLHRIFEPFVTTKGETGTGLGLWVTAEIVHKLSGRIRVKSRIASRPNEPAHSQPAPHHPQKVRTVFSVFLPACPEAPALAQSSEFLAVGAAS